ncbi:OmpA family protein [Aurantibacillus circumpalustris]|uniref:OmpA family protein n=1 Tax=Aurantibacillus circumpalustris TaxID=3036359 RepID=UPI00295BC73A|nr:OmpA family protein [Aurantibacillus circumpalustris]
MIQHKQIYILAFILAVINSSFAQISKGDKYFESGEYTKAIPCYKKELTSKKTDKHEEAMIKLANLYKLTNKYADAENTYRRLFELNPDQSKEVVFNYAQILKARSKYEEATEQYANYVQRNPDDESAKKALKFCREIKYHLSRSVEYKIENVGTINTDKSEFSPYVMNNKLIFIAEKQEFDFVNYSVDDYSGQPFMSMYISDIEGVNIQKSKQFSSKINTYYHDGPGCATADEQTLYFTRVNYVSKKGYVNRSQIYTATRDGKSWKAIKPINLNNKEYSIAHPSLSDDGTELYFTSNMDGGYGGKDIYVSKKEGDDWGTPVNLGPDINTPGDEMFPGIRKNGVLFFSSNGLPGFGGLDIFSAKFVKGKWTLNRNEGLDLNSSTDDFGVTFLNDTVGYFSSNRPGGKGLDDIFLFNFKNKSAIVDGTVLLTENSKDYAKGKKVLLLDELGNVVDSMYTDAKGYFAFKNLDGDRKYMASVMEEDPELVGKARFYLAENDSAIHRVTSKYKDNKFVFRNLPIDPNALPDLYTEDDLVFAGTIRVGNSGEALPNAKLKLVNDFGDVVEEATTNEYGAFAFRNIPSDQNYLIALDEGDIKLAEGTKIILTNKGGKDVRTFYKGKGNFTFKVLTADRTLLEDMDAEDVNLVMGIYGYMYDQDKKPIVNAKIRVKDEDGSNEQEWTTTASGKFNFKNLDAEKNYIFEADANDPSLSGVKRIYISDSKGRIYKIVDMDGGKFSFKILEVDKFSMGAFVVEDPSLKIAEIKKQKEELKKNPSIAPKEKEAKPAVVKAAEPEEESEMTVTIVENIYYAYGDYSIGEEGKAILDKAADALTDYPKLMLEISSHTDSQSSSEFNLGLSRKRAQTAVDYLVKKGISRGRLKATGYGETRLLNRCEDGVECTDAEHKVNRRTEFKITKPIKR